MFEFLHNFWFIQSIGVVALVFVILAWNAKERKNLLYLQAVNVTLMAFQYVLLGAFTGAVVQCITISRNLVFSQKGKRAWASHTVWLYVFIALAVGVLAFFWQGWISLLPVTGIIIGTYGMFKDEPKKMRIFILITGLVWIPYNILVHSYSGLVSDIVSYTALLVGMYRLDRKQPVTVA